MLESTSQGEAFNNQNAPMIFWVIYLPYPYYGIGPCKHLLIEHN